MSESSPVVIQSNISTAYSYYVGSIEQFESKVLNYSYKKLKEH